VGLGVLENSKASAAPVLVRVVQDPPPPPGPYPVRAGRHRPQDSYPYYRWQPPVAFARARFGPPPPHAAGMGAYYQTKYNKPIGGMGAYYQTKYNKPIGALGQLCPDCSFWDGVRCVPCPAGATLPECEGCEDGLPVTQEPSFWERSSFWGPVIVGTVTTIAGALALGYVMRGRD